MKFLWAVNNGIRCVCKFYHWIIYSRVFGVFGNFSEYVQISFNNLLKLWELIHLINKTKLQWIPLFSNLSALIASFYAVHFSHLLNSRIKDETIWYSHFFSLLLFSYFFCCYVWTLLYLYIYLELNQSNNVNNLRSHTKQATTEQQQYYWITKETFINCILMK